MIEYQNITKTVKTQEITKIQCDNCKKQIEQYYEFHSGHRVSGIASSDITEHHQVCSFNCFKKLCKSITNTKYFRCDTAYIGFHNDMEMWFLDDIE